MQTFLVLLAGAMLAMLAVFLLHPELARSEVSPPEDEAGLARWIAGHPSDWLAASAIVEHALDAPVSDRFALWHAAHALSLHLAPLRPHPHIAFAREGLFHWEELSPADRRSVLDSIDDLLHDRDRFTQLAAPIFYLTGDLALLRRAGPQTAETLQILEDLAAANGRFAEYRALREQLDHKLLADFQERVGMLDPDEIIQALPTRRLHRSDEPMLLAALRELHRRPLDSDPKRPSAVDALLDYALAHNLEPLDGLEAVTRIPGSASDPQRARLALRLGLPDRASEIELASAEVAPAPWQRYHLERAELERKRGDARAAEADLARAMVGGPSAAVLLATGGATQKPEIAPADWRGGCGPDVCDTAIAEVYVASPSQLKLAMGAVQTDEDWPYVEVFVDDARMAEGAVAQQAEFAVQLAPGLHTIELHLANPLTRNRLWRRVRVSSAKLVPAA